jgi:hypothetical protein
MIDEFSTPPLGNKALGSFILVANKVFHRDLVPYSLVVYSNFWASFLLHVGRCIRQLAIPFALVDEALMRACANAMLSPIFSR